MNRCIAMSKRPIVRAQIKSCWGESYVSDGVQPSVHARGIAARGRCMSARDSPCSLLSGAVARKHMRVDLTKHAAK